MCDMADLCTPICAAKAAADQKAAEDFFDQAAKTSGVYPYQITTDKEPALYPATFFAVALPVREDISRDKAIP